MGIRFFRLAAMWAGTFALAGAVFVGCFIVPLMREYATVFGLLGMTLHLGLVSVCIRAGKVAA